jgi:nucleoid-associated protein YgaU
LGEPGDYEIEVRVVNAAGQVLAASEPTTVTVEPEPVNDEEAINEADGQVYFVQENDWLSKLSEKFYGDIFAYDVIVEATNARAADDDSFIFIEDADIIEIGQQLWIPKILSIDVN